MLFSLLLCYYADCLLKKEDGFKLIFSGCSVEMLIVHSVEHNVFTFLLCFYRFL